MTICSVVNFYLLFVSFFATFCQYLSPSIFLSISQFRLQFSPIPPLGQLSKWAFTLRCLFPSILLPPPATQIRKIRKYANTQIRRYPNTPKHKNANTVEDGFHAPLFQPTPRLRFCHTNCIYWQYNCSKE